MINTVNKDKRKTKGQQKRWRIMVTYAYYFPRSTSLIHFFAFPPNVSVGGEEAR